MQAAKNFETQLAENQTAADPWNCRKSLGATDSQMQEDS